MESPGSKRRTLHIAAPSAESLRRLAEQEPASGDADDATATIDDCVVDDDVDVNVDVDVDVDVDIDAETDADARGHIDAASKGPGSLYSNGVAAPAADGGSNSSVLGGNASASYRNNAPNNACPAYNTVSEGVTCEDGSQSASTADLREEAGDDVIEVPSFSLADKKKGATLALGTRGTRPLTLAIGKASQGGPQGIPQSALSHHQLQQQHHHQQQLQQLQLHSAVHAQAASGPGTLHISHPRASYSPASATAATSAACVAPEVTVTAPVNIAVIKYWGKRDEELILPANSSLSVTLCQNVLNTRTTVRCDPNFGSDRLWLNGIEHPLSHRVVHILAVLRDECKKRSLANRIKEETEGQASSSANTPHSLTPQSACQSSSTQIWEQSMHIVSENNFPTAAGLASSASGHAALVVAVSTLFSLELSPTELSRIARMGSGSACRSVMPGFVAWDMGTRSDGLDSFARCVADHNHWPEFEALVVVTSDTVKHRPSADAMASSVNTSMLASYRFSHIVPARMAALEAAVRNRNFNEFANLCMRDSNEFHAICLDSFPPVFYLSETSRTIIQLIHDFNNSTDTLNQNHTPTPTPTSTSSTSNTNSSSSQDAAAPACRAAYTFDAGANAVIFTLRPYVRDLLAILEHYFPVTPGTPRELFFPDPYGIRGTLPRAANAAASTTSSVLQSFHTKVPVQAPGLVKRVLHARVGDGPRVLARGYVPDVSLLNRKGFPHRVRD